MNDDHGILMPVALDQLRAFDLNPRITRNPEYDEIKESIRYRGLDNPPQITKRPGESFYIIANGGNTRLAILNELWLETHDKKYWNIVCHFWKWKENWSVEEGNLHCLLGHLIENDNRGSLTFIERALGIQNSINIYQKIKGDCSQKDLVLMLNMAGYSMSTTLLSIVYATIQLLLPHIPTLLYSGLSRSNIDRLLMLRSNAEKFWDKFCRELPAAAEHQLPLFDDIFALALSPFNEPTAGFPLEQIQDELTGLISQTLNVDYNAVALVTDARAQKRITLLGSEPVPDLPEISEQRSVDMKYRDKTLTTTHQQVDNGEKAAIDTEKYDSDTADGENTPAAEPHHTPECLSISPTTSPPLAVNDPGGDPQADTPQALASLIDQTAWELAENAGLEFLISPTETGLFDIASPESGLSNEGKIYWQLLAFLAGKLPGSAAVWRQMMVGSPSAPAGFSEETLTKIYQLICYIRRFYTKQHKGETS
ncbi:hypothetical protein FZU01_20705 [Salmonella enterica subsp. enterica]|nr:hypothetical protein [Salmonella enterica subsp. enterica serovar Redlands]ECQ6566244.1 hypothetical protein [Salmonella enterica subsp. enterica serovar Kintambo]ECV5098146.1 hypothetical protein [Salmonella enterica subsp. enterica serovar Kintambo]